MPRLGLLLAALTPIRAWWERHAQDSSVLTLSVPAGDSFVRATQKLAEDCDLQENEAAIVDAFRGRYRFTLGDSDVAPYRMDLLVTSEHCHRQDISMSTASGWRHNFGALYFDGDDDVDALAALECARISAPGAGVAPCEKALAARLREVLRVAGARPPCAGACPHAQERRRHDDSTKRVETAIAAALAIERGDVEGSGAGAARALAMAGAALKSARSPPRRNDWPATSLKQCASVDPSTNETTTCILENVYVLNGQFLILHDDGDHIAKITDEGQPGGYVEMNQTRWLPRLRLAPSADSPVFEPKRLARQAFDDMRSSLGVPARDASVELLFALERVGDDQLHPGHVLTSYALAAYWAMSLLNLVSEPWRLHLTDKRPAFATDGWLASVVSEKPLYRRHLETTLCPRGSVCRIPRFVVGCGSLDWNQYRDKPHVFAPVHRAFAKRGRQLLGLPADDGARPRKALLIQRLHSRVIPDAKALATSVGADLVILDHMPLKEQLDLFDSTRVIIAVDGGALDLSLLARPATGFVTIKRPHDSESPDGCLNCPTGGPDGPCCDWHLALFGAANGTWLGAESLNPGAGLSVDPIALKGAISRVNTRLKELSEFKGQGDR